MEYKVKYYFEGREVKEHIRRSVDIDRLKLTLADSVRNNRRGLRLAEIVLPGGSWYINPERIIWAPRGEHFALPLTEDIIEEIGALAKRLGKTPLETLRELLDTWESLNLDNPAVKRNEGAGGSAPLKEE